jgi:signal transduction histidine kinase
VKLKLPIPAFIQDALLSLMRWSPGALAVLGPDRRPLVTTPALAKLTGLSTQELTQHDYLDLFADEEIAAMEAFLSRQGSPPICLGLKSGRMVEARHFPIELTGSQLQAVVLLDVTQEKRLLAKLGGLSQFAASLTYAGSLGATLDRLCQRTVEHTEAVSSAIVLVEEGLYRIGGTSGFENEKRSNIESILNAGCPLPPLRAFESGQLIIESNLKEQLAQLAQSGQWAPQVKQLSEIAKTQNFNTIICLPININGRAVAVLNCYYSDRTQLDQAETLFLQTLADLAAVAIENARLLLQAEQKAALEERQRLARELHDSVAQALYGAALGLKTAQVKLERNPDEVHEPLSYALALVEAATTEMRALIFSLRPESLEEEGLVRALGRHIEVLRVRHRLTVTTNFVEEPQLESQARYGMFRLATEALHNVVKHAQATEVQLSLGQDDQNYILEICDNGVGFDPEASYPGHYGLKSMSERMHSLGGKCEITSTPGQGTKIRASLTGLEHHQEG